MLNLKIICLGRFIKIFHPLIFVLIIISCGSKEYPKISLSDLDPKVKDRSSIMASDVIKSFTHEKGAMYLLDQNYITPKVRAGVKGNPGMFDDSYAIINKMVGKISKYKLVQVVNKGVVKSMRYKVTCENDELKYVELKIDINNSFKLAGFYLYITTENEAMKRVNFLPEIYLKY